MLQVIFKNFLSFDFIIFVLALLNTYVLICTIKYSRKLYDALNPYCWIPGGEASLKEIQGKFARRNRIDSESDIIALRRKMNGRYVVYENLTAIFPLLGLLGTVVSLIPLVDNLGEVATGMFFSALTSTMWGIIFAIIFKVANGYVASGIEDNEKNIDIYLQRNTDKILKMKAISESAEPYNATEKTESIQTTETAQEVEAVQTTETVQEMEPVQTTETVQKMETAPESGKEASEDDITMADEIFAAVSDIRKAEKESENANEEA